MKHILYVDERGYALCRDSETGVITAGCRTFKTTDDALAHWGAADYGCPERGAMFCAALRGQLPEVAALPDGLWSLHLGGGTLPEGTVLPDGLRHLHLGGGTLPEGTVLPGGLLELNLGGGALPEGTVLPERLQYLYLDGGTLPEGTAIPPETQVWR